MPDPTYPAPTNSSSPPASDVFPGDVFQQVLSRPDEQRLREHKCRCAQAMVFGLPVLALQWFGRSLGGAEADRWVGVLQALLAGWIVYVGATGMLVEGLLRRRIGFDLVVALTAALVYLYSAAIALSYLTSKPLNRTAQFHWVIALLALWSGLQWARYARSIRTLGAAPR